METSTDALFETLLSEALAHERVRLTELSRLYVRSLLVGQRRPPEGEPLGVSLLKAQDAAGRLRQELMKQTGDAALLQTFWWHKLMRRGLRVNYCIAIGEVAYGHLSDGIYRELSRKFERVANAVVAVSAETFARQTEQNLLSLCQAWQDTGNPTLGKILRKLGVHTGSIPARIQ